MADGYFSEIDLHDMTSAEAKRALDSYITGMPACGGELNVIHGCHGGTVLRDMVRRQYKHKRLERKILGLNNGATILVIGKK